MLSLLCRMKDNRFNFRMDEDLRNELEVLAKPSQMKIATLMKAILWTHINKQKDKSLPTPQKTAIQESPKQQQPTSKNQIPSIHGDVVVFNEFMDEKINCQTSEDWNKIVNEINANTTMNEKQRTTLLRPR